MIFKHRTFPKDIELLQTIERRLHDHHSQMPHVKDQLKYSLSGYKGELALNYPLSFLPHHYRIFHHLRLYDGTHYFQIDCLIVTDKWIVIIEVKNIGGELFYNQRFNYMTRKWTEGNHTFSDPVLQVRRHRLQLQQWLSTKKLPDLPIYCLVSNSHPETSIDTDDPDLNIVIRTEALPEKIAQVEASHTGPAIDPTSLDRITKNLMDSHSEHNYNYLEVLSLDRKDFIKGVICSTCQYVPMKRIYGTWKCLKCGYKNTDAHLPALRDYFFLYGSSITNKKMREFLLIESPDIAHRMLGKMNLKSSGKNKGRVYFLDF